MKWIHLGDLHLGKRVNGFSMLEDQAYILEEILKILDEERPDGLLIAGDVYDRAVPSAEAVRLLDDFLCRLSARGLPVYLISGNHDSPERLSFGGRLMEQSGIHISPVYEGRVEPICLEDAYGPIHLYLLPFLKAAQVRPFFPERKIESDSEALAAAIEAMEIDPGVRNVLVAHQFVVGGERSESEELLLGGTDGVDARVFDGFDYVALGHLHGPQKLGRESLRYCGSPLKYSFSEAEQKKSLTVVELREKGVVELRTLPLHPRRDLVKLRGSYETLTARDFYRGTHYREDYVQITLTDEEDITDAPAKLRIIYPYLMKLDYDNRRTRAASCIQGAEEIKRKSPLELLEEFYEKQNGQPMGEQQRELSRELIEKIWEEEP